MENRQARLWAGRGRHVRNVTSTESLALCQAQERVTDAAAALAEYVYWLYHDGVTQAEIGAVLDVTPDAISRRLKKYRPEADYGS
jgi:DNA-directed RNA polymerase specialized sigma subunit